MNERIENYQGSGYDAIIFKDEKSYRDAIGAPAWVLDRVEIAQHGFSIDLGFFALYRAK